MYENVGDVHNSPPSMRTQLPSMETDAHAMMMKISAVQHQQNNKDEAQAAAQHQQHHQHQHQQHQHQHQHQQHQQQQHQHQHQQHQHQHQQQQQHQHQYIFPVQIGGGDWQSSATSVAQMPDPDCGSQLYTHTDEDAGLLDAQSHNTNPSLVNVQTGFCMRVNCTNQAIAKNLCKAHGGSRHCTEPGCMKSAVGAINKYKAHGGGRRRSVQGCPKTAQGRTYKCKAHGGGKKCDEPAAQLRSARDMAAGDGAYKHIAIKVRKGLLTSALVMAVVIDVTSQIVQEVHAMPLKDALPMVEAKDACMMVADAVLEVLHISA